MVNSLESFELGSLRISDSKSLTCTYFSLDHWIMFLYPDSDAVIVMQGPKDKLGSKQPASHVHIQNVKHPKFVRHILGRRKSKVSEMVDLCGARVAASPF